MKTEFTDKSSLFRDIWCSFRGLPVWVQFSIVGIVLPVNVASLYFLDQPLGRWVAFLAIVALVSNVPVLVRDRGFSKSLSLPHVLPWTLLIVLIILARPMGTELYNSYLWVLLLTNLISLSFDIPNSVEWLREREGA